MAFNRMTFNRLGWKDLPGTNTLTYFVPVFNCEEESFITLAPGWGQRLFLRLHDPDMALPERNRRLQRGC
jgi:hypothetical protein